MTANPKPSQLGEKKQELLKITERLERNRQEYQRVQQALRETQLGDPRRPALFNRRNILSTKIEFDRLLKNRVQRGGKYLGEYHHEVSIPQAKPHK